MKIWIELNQASDLTDFELFSLVKPKMDFLMSSEGIFNSDLKELPSSQDYLIYYPKNLKTLNEVLTLTSAINEYFYKSIFLIPEKYQEFIAEVPDFLRNRLNSFDSNLIVYHMETNLTALFRELLLTYNTILPYLFLGTYFEEVADGFLIICHDLFDLSFIFRKNNAPDSGRDWLVENNFTLPPNIFEESLGWAMEKLKRTGFYSRN